MYNVVNNYVWEKKVYSPLADTNYIINDHAREIFNSPVILLETAIDIWSITTFKDRLTFYNGSLFILRSERSSSNVSKVRGNSKEKK